jgi:hypothetical protein
MFPRASGLAQFRYFLIGGYLQAVRKVLHIGEQGLGVLDQAICSRVGNRCAVVFRGLQQRNDLRLQRITLGPVGIQLGFYAGISRIAVYVIRGVRDQRCVMIGKQRV